MRSLKFRAWSKKHNSYLKVRGIQYDDDKIAGVFVGYGTIAGIPNTICLEPEDVILEQYTGLKDKNGKEIYEGDIATYEKDNIASVRFEYGGFYPFVEPYNDFGCPSGEDVEVIGNIHENADLLGDK